jgi:hypothetical protein
MATANFKYQLLDKFSSDEDSLKKLRKILVQSYIKESCKSNANIRKSLMLLVDLEDEIVKRQIMESERREQELKNAAGSSSNILLAPGNSGSQVISGGPNHNSAVKSNIGFNVEAELQEEPVVKEDNERGFSNLQALLSNRKKWKEGLTEVETILFALCSKGIPNYLRAEFWTGLGHKEDLLKNTSRTFIQHVKMNAYNKRITEFDAVDREYEQKTYYLLLEHSKKGYTLLNQEVQDDILSQIEMDKSIYSDHIDKNFMQHLQNILMAYTYWSGVMASTLTKNVENFSVNYSLPVLKICEKLITLFNSHFVFSSQVDLQHAGSNGSINVDFPYGHDDRSHIDHDRAHSEKKEEDVFWLLVCITSFVLRRYYHFKNLSIDENNNPSAIITIEEPLGIINFLKTSDMKAPMQTCDIGGLRGDLLLLKMSVKANIPDIHDKICELGLPLEYYFGNCFLDIFSEYFNNELLFRVWDMLFYEASLGTEVSNNFYLF